MTAGHRSEVAWSALASGWDTSGAAWNRPVAARLVQLAGLRPGMSVLDVGCGVGAATFPAARAVRPGGWLLVEERDGSASFGAADPSHARAAGYDRRTHALLAALQAADSALVTF